VAIVGEAYVVVKAITVGFNQQIQQALNGIGTAGSQAGQNVGKAFSSGAASGLSKADQSAKATYNSINKLIEGGYYLQSAVVAAAGGIAVLAGGLFALGSQLAAATPALIVLPSIFSAIAQAGIAAKLAFGGIGKAVGALTKPPSGGVKLDRMPDLLEAMARAEERVKLASERSVKATKALDQARLDAAESAEQLKFSSEDAALGEKRAALNLEKARKTLARVQDLPPNSTARKEAELAYQEAELGYRKAKDTNADLAKEVDKNAAAGIEGSKEVIAAKEAIADADREAKHAADAAAKADRAVKAEQKKQASGGGGADPLAGLTPEAAKFAKYLADLKPKIDELKSAVGKTLFPPLEIAIDNLVKNLFPSLKTILADTGEALGKSAIDFSKIVTEADNLKNLNTVAGTNKDTIGKLGKVTGNLYSVFLSLLAAADPLIRRFTDWVVSLTDGWKNAEILKNEGGKLTDMFNGAGDVAAQLGDILGNVGGAFLDMGKAAAGPGSGGQMIFDFLEKATEKFRDFTKAGLKDGSLEEYFKKVAESFTKVLEAIGKISGAILKTGDDKGTTDFFTSLSDAAGFLADALTKLSEGGVGTQFGEFIKKMAEFLSTTSESGSIKIYFGILNVALGLLNKILSNPIAGKILGMAAAAHGARTAFSRFGKTLTLTKDYLQGGFLSMKDGVGKIKSLAGGVKNMAGNFSAARSMNLGYFKSLKMTLGYTKLGAAATKAWTRIQAAFNAVMALNPITLVVIAIVALIAIIVAAYFKFQWFRDFVDGIWDAIASKLTLVYNTIIKPVFDAMLAVFTLVWDGIKAAFNLVWDIIKAAIELYWNFYIKPIFELMLAVFKIVWEGIKIAFNLVWDIIKAAIDFGWNFVIKPIFDLMLTVFKIAWDGIKGAFNLVWDIIKAAIKFGWNNVIKPIFDLFGSVFGSVWDGIKTAFSKTWDFITGAISKAKDIFGGLGDSIKGAFKTAFNFVADAWNKSIGKIGFKAPKWLGGWEFSVPNITPLAEGGTVYPRPGGLIARIGEAGRAERVEPLDSQGLSKRDRAIITMLSGGQSNGGINITVNPSPGMDEVELAALVSRQISFQLRRGAA